MNTKDSTQYKTTLQFVEFIGGKGNVNFLSNEATVTGKQLSGLDLDNITFKLTIKEDGVDFEEIDTQVTNFEQRKRLLQIIEEKTITTYRNRSVITEIEFLSTKKVKDKFIPLYLAIEVEKPIEKLAGILDEPLSLSDDAFDNLSDLLNSWFEDEDFAKEIQEMVNEEEMNQVINDIDVVQKQLESQFENLKLEKLATLKSDKTKKIKEITQLEWTISSSETKLETLKKDLELLESRLKDLQPNVDSNGYYFFLSERQNEKVILDDATEKLIRDKVTKVKSINVENFMKLFSEGEFFLYLGKMNGDTVEIVEKVDEVDTDIIQSVSSLKSITSFKFQDNKIVINCDTWAELVNHLIKSGFQQNSDFDKICEQFHPKTDTETKSSNF
jgi:hypothetical protein